MVESHLASISTGNFTYIFFMMYMKLYYNNDTLSRCSYSVVAFNRERHLLMYSLDKTVFFSIPHMIQNGSAIILWS
jgi:hypothetical protein